MSFLWRLPSRKLNIFHLRKSPNLMSHFFCSLQIHCFAAIDKRLLSTKYHKYIITHSHDRCGTNRRQCEFFRLFHWTSKFSFMGSKSPQIPIIVINTLKFFFAISTTTTCKQVKNQSQPPEKNTNWKIEITIFFTLRTQKHAQFF